MEIEVERVLTEEAFDDLISLSNDWENDDRPPYWDDNHTEWVAWIYSKGYRVVKIHSSAPSAKKEME